MKKLNFILAAMFLALLFPAAATFAQPASKTTVNKASATFQKIWIDYDVTDNGVRGMRIHTAFKALGMKGVSSYLQIKFQMRDGTPLMDKNGAFDHEDGSVAAFGVLKPGYDPAVYEDFDVFMPYAELDLTPGKYQLMMDVDVIYEDGTLVQHLTAYNFEFTEPAKVSAAFNKIWVDYDVTQNGVRGMRIHTAFKTYGMKGTGAYLQIKFQKRDGTALMDKNGEFVHEDGSVAAFVKLRPGFDTAEFEDEPIFMPYAELDLTPGKHQLTMDVDVIYENGTLVSHLTSYDFEYTKPAR